MDPGKVFMEKERHPESLLVEALSRWFATGQGKMVLAHESEILAQVVQEFFGYFMLESGWFSNMPDYVSNCAVKNFYRLSPDTLHLGQIMASPLSLPIATDSVDAVILPHTLDFAPDPRQVLREVERVLIPEGRLVVVGFNPFSLWGLRRRMPGARRQQPWRGHFISEGRVQDWLSLLGLEVEKSHNLLFRPPWKKMFVKQRFPRFNRMGQRFWPWFAGVYVIVAIKRVSTLTPIRPRWNMKRKLGKVVIQPIANGMQNRAEK